MRAVLWRAADSNSWQTPETWTWTWTSTRTSTRAPELNPRFSSMQMTDEFIASILLPFLESWEKHLIVDLNQQIRLIKFRTKGCCFFYFGGRGLSWGRDDWRSDSTSIHSLWTCSKNCSRWSLVQVTAFELNNEVSGLRNQKVSGFRFLIAAVSRVNERFLVWLVHLLGNVHPKWKKYKMYKLHPDNSSNTSTSCELVTADGCENSRSQ